MIRTYTDLTWNWFVISWERLGLAAHPGHYSVNLWGSHPDAGNDDCWTGAYFPTLLDAIEARENVLSPAAHGLGDNHGIAAHCTGWEFVETKQSLSLALICQAMERRRSARRVFVAAPYTRHMNDVEMLCRELGIGLLQVSTAEPGYGSTPVQERCESRRWNRKPVALAAELSPEHKTHARAGTSGGGRWTPFRNTAEQVSRIVRAQPGITLKAVIDQIRHHYASSSSARSTLAARIESGLIAGVRLDRSTKGALRLQPTETP